MRILMIAALLLMAGCAAPIDTADVTIAGGGLDSTTAIAFDDGSRPTIHLYTIHGKEHAPFYTAHDLLLEWSTQDRHDLEVEWFDSSFGYGYALCAVDDFPPRIMDGIARGCFERDGFWAMSVNGEAAQVSMGEIQIRDGDTFALTWTGY